MVREVLLVQVKECILVTLILGALVQYKYKGAMDEEWCVPILSHTTHTHTAQYNYFVLYHVPFPEVTSHLVSRIHQTLVLRKRLLLSALRPRVCTPFLFCIAVQDIYFFFLAVPHSLWNPSSQNWECTWVP